MASRPKQPVAKGGLWSTQKPTVSKETQELLKVMMQESKLTNFQQKQLNERLKGGQSFPTDVNPTSSGRKQPRATLSPKESSKAISARQLCGSGKRTQADIQKRLENDEDEPYRPKPGKCITDKDKRRLQNKMAYGEDGAAIEETPRLRRQPQQELKNKPEVDRFDEVLQLIEERKQFLDDMEKLGQGKKYRTIIATEISQGIRELELIDKKRTQELDLALEDRTDSSANLESTTSS